MPTRTEAMQLLKSAAEDLNGADPDNDGGDMGALLDLTAANTKAQIATAIGINRIADLLGQHLPRLR